MANPSHYVANLDNAHIDTSAFKTRVRQLLACDASNQGVAQYPWNRIHDLVESTVTGAPDEPSDDQLICRYLSPIKFLWFVSQASVYFGSAASQTDQKDSAIPEDYNNAVLAELGDAKLDGFAWDRYCRGKQSQWLVSCWTKLDNYFDDNLLWHSYAGGAHGVGVTVRYGVLRDYLSDAVTKEVDVTDFYCGEISYQGPLRVAPFNKRKMFRNEKEVRFVTCSTSRKFLNIDISMIQSQLGLRLSSESTVEHRDAVKDVWRKFGGSNEIHTSGD